MLSLVFSKMCAIEKQNNRILRRLKQLQEIADEDFKEVAFKVKINIYVVYLQNAFSKRKLFFFQEQSTSAIKEADYDEEKFEPGGKSIVVDSKPCNDKTS